MRLLEVTRPSDKAAERAKHAAKEEAFKKRVVASYVGKLKAPQYTPHPRDVEVWLFGGKGDEEAMKELQVWTDAVAFMAGVTDLNQQLPGREPEVPHEAFRTFSHFIDIPHDLVDFVCAGGHLDEEPKK